MCSGKIFYQVFQFVTNIALYVKCSKMRLYISLRGHFKQLCSGKVFLDGLASHRSILKGLYVIKQIGIAG